MSKTQTILNDIKKGLNNSKYKDDVQNLLDRFNKGKYTIVDRNEANIEQYVEELGCKKFNAVIIKNSEIKFISNVPFERIEKINLKIKKTDLSTFDDFLSHNDCRCIIIDKTDSSLPVFVFCFDKKAKYVINVQNKFKKFMSENLDKTSNKVASKKVKSVKSKINLTQEKKPIEIGLSKQRKIGIFFAIIIGIAGIVGFLTSMIISIINWSKPHSDINIGSIFGLMFLWLYLGLCLGLLNFWSIKNYLHENHISPLAHVARGFLLQGIIPGIIMLILYKNNDHSADGADYSSIPVDSDDDEIYIPRKRYAGMAKSNNSTIWTSSGEYRRNGNTVYGPNGEYRKSGNTIFGPDGEYRRNGNQVFGPKGTYTIIDNQIFGPKGEIHTKLDNRVEGAKKDDAVGAIVSLFN